MIKTPFDTMICDSDMGDGGISFYDDYFEWSNRDNRKSFKINYLDINEVKIIYGIKKTVIVVLKDGSERKLYLYKADTLREVIKKQIDKLEGNIQPGEVVDAEVSKKEDDLSKLERLAKLHESGALTDEEFKKAKEKILG